MTKFTSIGKSLIREKNDINTGANVYFLGFPFGIGSNQGYYGTTFFSDKRINPLVRGGIVAWKSDENKEFLVDGISSGGNSGSPVFTQYDPIHKKEPALIGMVLGHLAEPVDSTDSIGRINQGLARCIWIDDILKLADTIK